MAKHRRSTSSSSVSDFPSTLELESQVRVDQNPQSNNGTGGHKSNTGNAIAVSKIEKERDENRSGVNWNKSLISASPSSTHHYPCTKRSNNMRSEPVENNECVCATQNAETPVSYLHSLRSDFSTIPSELTELESGGSSVEEDKDPDSDDEVRNAGAVWMALKKVHRAQERHIQAVMQIHK